MTIEEEIFRRTKIDFDKVSRYGFKKDKTLYKYSKNIMNNTFRVDIEIDSDEIIKGKIYDLSFGDEYTNFRIEDDTTGSFVGQVRNEFKNLLKQDGFYPAYHMNKKNWITVILDNTISDEKIMNLIDKSYSYTVVNRNCAKNEWIVPANPKYFDIDKALKEKNTMLWKQSTDIKIDDIVYVYVGMPCSSIMYKFKVIEVNIPYQYKDKNLKIQRAMKIDLITRYEKGKLSFRKLKEFGINAIRGPRYMPLELSEYIKRVKG